MKILILEDEPQGAKRLAKLLHEYDPDSEIVAVLTNVRDAMDFFRSSHYLDLIMADIRLSDGISLEALKHAPSQVPIIFTTAYDEYAVQAFKFNSIDYLLKPIDIDELYEAIEKVKNRGTLVGDFDFKSLLDAMHHNRMRYRERFLLPFRDGYKTVSVADVNHIEVENKIVYLRMNDGTSKTVNISLDDLEKQLDTSIFFRANRQFIININAVLFIGNLFSGKLIVRLKGYPKSEIIVSRDKAGKLKEWLDR